jgi:hypothetical protein
MRNDDLCQRDAVLVLHRVADDREGIGADLPLWSDVVRLVEIALVDVGLGHEAVDRVRAFDLDRLQLVFVDLDVMALADFVAAALMLGIDHGAQSAHRPFAGAGGGRCWY